MDQVKKNQMTREGIEKLEKELEYLKTTKRADITEKIKIALGFGDLSENAEYTEAKNEQGQVEGRILQLESILKNAEVVDESEVPEDTIYIGSIVTVLDNELDEEVDFYIVGSAEADPLNDRVSIESPVGKALAGKKKGDTVEVTTPQGVIKFDILNVRRD